MINECRVVVVGGGVMGCSLLYHLAKLGWHDTVLLEKNELTAGSTWHAAGLCTHYAHNATVMNLRARSVQLYSGELQRDTGQPVSFHATGALRVTCNPDRLAEFRHVQGVGRIAGQEFHILTPGELRQLYPLVQTEGLVGAIHEPLDGHVDPSQATQAFAAGARNEGAQIYRHTTVKSIRRERSYWRVGTSHGDILCEHVVNAAGTWCREIGTMMGVDLPVVPMLHQYIVTDRVAEFASLPDELPFIRDPDESWYLRQERDGLIIGPYEKKGVPWSVDGVPDEFGMELLPPDLERIEGIAAMAMQRVPAAAEGGIKTIVNGPITFTPDANPLIGPAFGLDNAWLLTGSSMGVMEGGGAGDFLAQWMVSGEPPADALAVDARRFGDYADRRYRVAKAVECFAAQFGIHYPYEERPAARNQRRSAVYESLAQLGAVFGVAYGWERANYFAQNAVAAQPILSFARSNWFSSVADECEAVAQRAGVADLSAFSKFEITGADSEAFIATLGCNVAPSPGRINLNLVLDSAGGVLLEFSVTCLAPQQYLLVTAAAAERIAADTLRLRSARFAALAVHNRTRELAVTAVMGPQAQAVLQSLTDTDLRQSAFPWLSAQSITVAGVDVQALRVSYIGENGWELCSAAGDQPALFAALMAAGKPVGMRPYGAFAMNALRLEKGYRAWGADYSTERTPREAGMHRLVKSAGRCCIGAENMVLRDDRKDARQMQLLALDVDTIDPFYLHPVSQNGRVIGMVTSGAFGHRTELALALAYFSAAPDIRSDLTVELTGQGVAARVLQQVPYDPANQKLLA